MSNYLAIATVTEALRRIIHPGGDLPDVEITTLRPDAINDQSNGVNIYLYQTTPNAAWRNADLPMRNTGHGELINRPRAALDLNYLFTFYGDESVHIPQRLLGKVTIALHENPVIDQDTIEQVKGSGGALNFLANSDLDDQIELVRITPVPLSLDDLSKLWTVFSQAHYRLSMVYRASVVLLESEQIPVRPMPVHEPRIYIKPFRRPVIDKIFSSEGENVPITMDSNLVISGNNLMNDVTMIRIAGQEVALDPTRDTILNNRIEFALKELPDRNPSILFSCQVYGLQVVHKIKKQAAMPGDAEMALWESNTSPFVLHPAIKATKKNKTDEGSGEYSGDIEIKFSPGIAKTQRVVLLMYDSVNESDMPRYSFTNLARENDIDVLVFNVHVAAGKYLLQVRVEGIESYLDPDNVDLVVDC